MDASWIPPTIAVALAAWQNQAGQRVLKAEMAALRAELKADIEILRTEIGAVKEIMAVKFQSIDRDLRKLEEARK